MTENLPATAPLTGTIVTGTRTPATIPAAVALGANLYAAIAAPPVTGTHDADRAIRAGKQLAARLIVETMAAFAAGSEHVVLSTFSSVVSRAFGALDGNDGTDTMTNLAPAALRIHSTPTEVNQSIDPWTGDRVWTQFKIGR